MDIISYSKASKVERKLSSLFVEVKSENLFNSDDVNTGHCFEQNTNSSKIGDLKSFNSASTAYVPIDGAGNYSWVYAKGLFGSMNGAVVLFYDSNKNYLSYTTGTVDSTDDTILHFSVLQSHIDSGAVYFGYTVLNTAKSTAMIVKSNKYPEEYIKYFNLGNKIKSTELESITEKEKSPNLFNKDGEIKIRTAINVSTGAETAFASESVQYIPFEGAGTYYCLFPQEYYGYNNLKLCLYDENKSFLRAVSGTKTVSESAPNPAYFTVSSADAVNVAYIAYCFKSTTKDEAMFVKSTTYPSEYIPYYPSKLVLSKDVGVEDESIPQVNFNPLYGKSVVFDGDSICEAPSTGGWARYIGEANNMEWHNVGVSGGTITAELYSDGGSAKHWVSRYIDTIHSTYPDLDYLILEGGTNDADILTNEEIGTIDQANFTTFNDEIYVGALESLFFKAISYYPTAKIGFIVAHRMGSTSGYGYESGDSPASRRRRKFFEIAIDVCKKWGIPYIDLWEGSPLNPKLECYYDSSKTASENTEAGKAYTDAQHLTQVGYNIISPKIEAWMKTL